MERYPMFTIRRIDIFTVCILPKTIYRFNAIPNKIQMAFYINKISNHKVVCYHKRAQVAKVIQLKEERS